VSGLLKSWWQKVMGGAPAAAAQPISGGALNELYDRQTAEVIARVVKRDSSCVDVGCHEGSILDVILRHAPEARHFAFEPLPHLFSKLRDKYAGRPNIVLHDTALSEAPGESTFQHVVTNPAYSGILRRRFDRPHEEVVEIRVRLERLDEVVPGDQAIRLVKIDVEGAELQVLRGASGILARCKPFVVFEHGQGSSEFYGTRPQDVHDLFTGHGMKVSTLGDWLETGGKRTLSREAFVEQYEKVTNYYFLAHA
jgi:FkbM family methyltransferase